MPISNNILAGSGQGGADLGDEIAKSLRFNGDEHLNRTLGANVTTATVAVWVKFVSHRSLLNNDTTRGTLWRAESGLNNLFYQYDSSDHGRIQSAGSQSIGDLTGRYRDPHGWYHFVYQYTNSNTTHKLWINGDRVQSDQSESSHSINAGVFTIGALATDDNTPGLQFDGYMADFHFVDGTALAPTILVGITTKVYGFLKFLKEIMDPKVSIQNFNDLSDIGKDVAPITGNHSSANDLSDTNFNLAAISSSNENNDQVNDTPSNNYCIMTPIAVLQF